jgi:hypothetical protein
MRKSLSVRQCCMGRSTYTRPHRRARHHHLSPRIRRTLLPRGRLRHHLLLHHHRLPANQIHLSRRPCLRRPSKACLPCGSSVLLRAASMMGQAAFPFQISWTRIFPRSSRPVRATTHGCLSRSVTRLSSRLWPCTTALAKHGSKGSSDPSRFGEDLTLATPDNSRGSPQGHVEKAIYSVALEKLVRLRLSFGVGSKGMPTSSPCVNRGSIVRSHLRSS